MKEFLMCYVGIKRTLIHYFYFMRTQKEILGYYKYKFHDIDKIINQAYSIGRDGNIFQNNYSIVKTWYEKFDLTPTFSYNSDAFTGLVSQMNTSFADGMKDPSYEIDGKNLIITAGKDGYAVNTNSLADLVVKKLIANDNDYCL